MEGLDVGLEAPEIDESTIDTADTGAEASADETAAAETADVDGQTEGDQQVAGPLVQNGKLTPAAKAVVDKLRAENPAVAKAFQKALFAEERLRRELPGGFQEIQQLRGRIEELGGDQGIQDTYKELDGWRGFDEQYMAGDPKVLDFLMGDEGGKSAFLKIAPAAFEKYREAAPANFASYVCKQVLDDMRGWDSGNGQRVDLLLEVDRLGDLIPQDNARAVQIYRTLKGYMDALAHTAQRPMQMPQAAAKQDDTRVKELETRESNLKKQEWGGEVRGKHSSAYTAAWKAVIGDRKLTDVQKDGLMELYQGRLRAAIKERGIDDKLNRFFGAGDKAGYLKYMDAFYKELAPKALRSAMERMGLGAKPGPKPGQASTAAKTAPVKVDAGFKVIPQKPDMATINNVLTNSAMWARKQAVLKSGQRVQWT